MHKPLAETYNLEVQLTGELTCYPDFTITGYGYRLFFGSFSPFLSIRGFDGSTSLITLYGHHVFLLSKEKYCKWCGAPIPSYSPLGLCETCYFSPRGIKYRSIVEGCSNSLEIPDYQYIIYLASIGNVVKVGTSRIDRNGVKGGFIFRLLEQGAGFFAVFDGGWGVCEAQEIEEIVVRELGLTDRVTFTEKIELFMGEEVSERVFNMLVEEVLDLIDAKLIALGRFKWSFPSFDRIWDSDVILGDVVGYRGNLVVFDDGSSRFVVDLSALTGRGLVTGEV